MRTPDVVIAPAALVGMTSSRIRACACELLSSGLRRILCVFQSAGDELDSMALLRHSRRYMRALDGLAPEDAHESSSRERRKARSNRARLAASRPPQLIGRCGEPCGLGCRRMSDRRGPRLRLPLTYIDWQLVVDGLATDRRGPGKSCLVLEQHHGNRSGCAPLPLAHRRQSRRAPAA